MEMFNIRSFILDKKRPNDIVGIILEGPAKGQFAVINRESGLIRPHHVGTVFRVEKEEAVLPFTMKTSKGVEIVKVATGGLAIEDVNQLDEVIRIMEEGDG